MSLLPYKPGKAFGYALLIWIVGFVWGSIVFMTPALNQIPSIRYVSKYPLISFPLLIAWLGLTFFIARKHLRPVADKTGEGLKLGAMLAVVNFALDLIVLVALFKAGAGYFASLTVWLAYLVLLIVPWLTGRHLLTR